MKKFTYFPILFIIISPFLYTQSNKKIEFCALGSLNFYNLSYDYSGEIPVPEHSPELSYAFGGGANYYLSDKFFLETNILYKVKKSELIKFSGLEWEDTFYQFKYLTLPILAHYHFPVSKSNIFITLGLETGILLKSRVEDKRNNVIVEPIENTNSTDFQLISGFGIRYKKLSLEFRYGCGLLNLNKEKTTGFSVKNSGFEFLVAYHF